MSEQIIFVLALLLTSLCLLVLGGTDSKRDPSLRGQHATSRRLRSVLWTVALTPGVYYLLEQNGAYFLMWFGTATVIGWLVALGLPPPSGENSNR